MLPRPLYRYHLQCLVLILVVTLSACRTTPEPTPALPSATPPSLTPASAAPTSRQPMPTSTAFADPPQHGQPTILSFTLTLPDDWQYVTLTERTYQQALRTLATENPTLGSQVDGLLRGQEAPSALVVAWPAEPPGNNGLIAYAIPRRDLTLHRYQRAVGQLLATEPMLTMHETTIRYDLRDDIPVGYLHYTTASTQHMSIQGHHYWLLNDSATELLLLTFVHGTLLNSERHALRSSSDDGSQFAQIVKEVQRGPAIVAVEE